MILSMKLAQLLSACHLEGVLRIAVIGQAQRIVMVHFFSFSGRARNFFAHAAQTWCARNFSEPTWGFVVLQ
jgi:hypothetical protein